MKLKDKMCLPELPFQRKLSPADNTINKGNGHQHPKKCKGTAGSRVEIRAHEFFHRNNL